MKPLLLLDVDGVLNAVCSKFPNTWPEQTWHAPQAGPWTITWADGMAEAVRQWAALAEVRWLTTWCHRANSDISPLLNIPTFPVEDLEHGDPEGGWGWWKWSAVQRLAKEFPDRKIVWVDDDIRYENRKNPDFAAFLKGSNVTAVSPKTAEGLTPNQCLTVTQLLKV